MRSFLYLLSPMCFLAVGIGASAEETYLTITGDKVSTLDVFQDCDACPDMIVLPLGRFQMGSSVAEAHAARIRYYTNRNIDLDVSEYEKVLRQKLLNLGIDPDQSELGLRAYYVSGNVDQDDDPQNSINPFLHEVPAHPVSIDMPIAIGRNEVTREEWAACVTEGGCERGQKDVPPDEYIACSRATDCHPTPDSRAQFRIQSHPHPTHPRVPKSGMTYYEMREYTSWLNDKVGANVYRIPTETEWEYAARAGTTTRFAQGDALTLGQANFLVSRRDVVDGEYVWENELGSARELLPVDDLDAANDWGLRHMSGNVSEFTSTCGSGPHRGLATSSQYLAADSDRLNCRRSVKGGMYTGNVELTRPARRVPLSDGYWSPSLGFRVVRDLTPAFEIEN